jgi:hypothetical protein
VCSTEPTLKSQSGTTIGGQTGSPSLCSTEPALRSQIGNTGESSIRSNENPSEDNSNRTEPRGWLAPVHVNGILMMLAVDTGAAMTIINYRKFLQHLDESIIQPSAHTFHTAAGSTMPALGQLAATLKFGPVTIRGLITTVAEVVRNGLLGLDFLRSADAWVGLRDGFLHMKVK